MLNNVSFRRSTFESIEKDARVFPQLKYLVDFLISWTSALL